MISTENSRNSVLKTNVLQDSSKCIIIRYMTVAIYVLTNG